MSYISSDITNQFNTNRNQKSINLNNIINDTKEEKNAKPPINNIDPIQEQFKRMSERHKQKKINEEKNKIKNEAVNNKKDNNEENKNEKKEEKRNKNDYIKIMTPDLDIEIQQKNHLLNLIFDGYTVIFIQYHNHRLKLKNLSIKDSEQAYKNASNYPENQFYSMYQLFILSRALLEIDDYIFNSSDDCLEFLYKLPYQDIVKLYDTFYEEIKKQNQIINNIGHFYDFVKEPFFRMKYKVMKAFHCLPTEDRCLQMNDAQWLWLYYNLEEDMFERMDEIQDNLDYMGFYLNSDAAKKVMQHNQAYRKKRDQKRQAKFYASMPSVQQQEQKENKPAEKNANQILDNFFTSTPVTNDNTVYNTAFEQELAQAIGSTDISKVTEISDDHEAGNPFESEADFMERVKAFAQVAGTNYGYIKPEKPPQLRVARKENYNPEANIDNGNESRIQRYLRNTMQYNQLKNSNINPLPIQETKSNTNTINEKSNVQKLKDKVLPIQNKQINNKKINDTLKQQADIEFMQKMHINNLNEMDKFKNIKDNNTNVDFIDFEED